MSGLVTLLRSILFILFEGGIHFVQLAGGLFEVSDSLAEPSPDFRQPVRAEQHHHNQQYYEQMRYAE